MKTKLFTLATVFGAVLGASVTPIWAAECITAAPTKALAHSTLASAAGYSGDVEAGGLLNFDRFRQEAAAAAPAAVPTEGFEGRYQSSMFDRSLARPTFLWAKTDAVAIPVGALTIKEQLVARARAQLKSEAAQLKLTEAMIDSAVVSDAQYNGTGPAIVRFKQQANGLPVFSRTLNVLLDRSGKPIAVSGYFATDYAPSSLSSLSFNRSGAQAISAAWAGLGGGVMSAVNLSQLVPTVRKGEWQSFHVPALSALSSHVFEREPRVKAGYFARKGRLEPAYIVELFAKARVNRQLIAYSLTVSAIDGSVLHRENLKASEVAPGTTSKPFTYRMFADPTYPYQLFDQPLGNGYTPFPATDPKATIARIANPAIANLVTLAYGPISTKDAWLTDAAQVTTGNNVDACLDLNDTAVDGVLSTPLNTCDPAVLGDYRASPSSDHTFDYIATPDGDPSTAAAQGGAVVSLFYLNNWLHDWWYDHGFDEVSGNAQTSNYGRGAPHTGTTDPTEGDPIKAQGQDASGRNNANMSTPADGSQPTMQQYLFDGPLVGEIRQLKPTDSGPLKFTGASFGPNEFDVTAAAILAADGAATVTDGCGMAIPDPAGLGVIPGVPGTPQLAAANKILIIDRGTCSFTTKALFATLSGASGMIVINNTDADPITMGNADIPLVPIPESPTDMVYQIPSVMIRKDAGALLKAQLAAGQTVTMHMLRVASIDTDGTLDNQVVGHEFFHYVHHRLTDSSNQQANAMSEGWGDTDAMMISVRPDDLSQPDNDHWQGAYGLAGYVIDNFYNGIRRAPYSTDFNKNAYTFKHISDGTATPDGGAGATNSEVHAAGEIWANAMWNCYAGILNTKNNGTFLEKQTRMKDYIIGGFKMTPTDSTYTEARDAVIGVALATNFVDYEACSDGFAARGMGLNAVSPARDSTDLTVDQSGGVKMEDYTPFVCKSATVPTTPGNPGTPATPTPSIPGVSGASATSSGRFGGAFGSLLLLPLFGMGLWRRRRRAA